MAVATPATLPVPTRLARPVAKAWNEEMSLLPATWLRPPSISFTPRGSRRICMKPMRRVKNRPMPSNR
ncbi:hypothetical protein D3C72_2419870 [compost metagenome]